VTRIDAAPGAESYDPGAGAPTNSPRARLTFPRPEWIFLALALPFGLAFLILTPPFQVPDEEAHLRRAFGISEGHIIAEKRDQYTGDVLPRSLETFYDRFKPLKTHLEEKTTPEDIRQAANIALRPDDREFAAFSNSAIHPPLPYLPQALGVLLARCFSTSVLACLYAGRMVNLLTALAILFLCIRQTPVGKWAFAALALTPMALTLDASLSPDALTNALCFLLTARVLACARGPEAAISTRSIVVLALLGAAVGLTKQSYFLLPLCYLLIPIRKGGTTRRYWSRFGLVMGATFLAVCCWAFVVHHIWSPADPTMKIDPGQQLALIRSDPTGFSRIFWLTLRNTPFHVTEYLGRLGWAEVWLPMWVYYTECVLLGALFLWEFGPRSRLTAMQALLAAIVAALVGCVVLFIMHLTWDEIGAPYITLHGRYFIPTGPLLGMAIGHLAYLLPRALDRVLAFTPAVIALWVPVLMVVTLVTVYERFFVDSIPDAARRHSARAEAFLREDPPARDQAREEFEEALKLDPNHIPSHRWLGIMKFDDSRLDEAEKHLRALLQAEPDDKVCLFRLANVLAVRADFAEAIPLYDKALAVTGGNETVAKDRERAIRMRDFFRQIAMDFEKQLRAGMMEPRDPGAPRAGLYLKAIRGPVVAGGDQPVLSRVSFLWRSPPPEGTAIRLSEGGDASRRSPFYACSVSLIGTRRIFLFPSGKNLRLLADDEVSWFFQVPLADLSESERKREDTYRHDLKLTFPLNKLPE
jgi:uncharacterized membrane protein